MNPAMMNEMICAWALYDFESLDPQIKNSGMASCTPREPTGKPLAIIMDYASQDYR